MRGKPIKRPIRQVTHADIVEGVLGVEQTINTLKTLGSNLVTKVDNKIEEVTELVETTVKDLKQATRDIEDLQHEALELISEIKQGEPGRDADEEAIEERVFSRIPKIDKESIIEEAVSRVPVLDVKKLKNDILSMVPRKADLKVIQERTEIDPMSVIEKIMQLPEEKRKGLKMKVENIDGLSQTISAMQSQLGRGYLHGGGISDITGLVTAGTNVTITGSGTTTSPYVINSTGGGTPGGSTTQLQYNSAGAFGGITGATTNGTTVTYTTGNLIAHDVKASQSAGMDILSNNGTVTALFGAGGGANSTFYGGSKFDYATASTVPYFDASKNLISSAVTPTELGYLSGTTSSIQTQLDGKVSTTGTANTALFYDSSGNVTSTTNVKVGAGPGGAVTPYCLYINNPNFYGEGDADSAFTARCGYGDTSEGILNMGDQAITMATVGYNAVFQQYRTRGTFASKSNLNTGDVVGSFNFRGQANGGSRYLGGMQLTYQGNGITSLSSFEWKVSGGTTAIGIDSSAYAYMPLRLRIGSSVAATQVLDVTGSALVSGSVYVGSNTNNGISSSSNTLQFSAGGANVGFLTSSGLTLGQSGQSYAQTLALTNGGSGTNYNAGSFTLISGRGTGSGTAGDFIFQTADVTTSGTTQQALTTKMTLKAAGNLGLGSTTVALGHLQVTDTGTASTRGFAVTQHNTGVQGALINYYKSRGTEASPTTIVNGDYGGIFTYNNYDGTAYRTNANFGWRSTDTVATNSLPGQLFFAVSSASDNDPYTTGDIAMVINHDNKIGLGTTAPAYNVDLVGSSNTSDITFRVKNGSSGSGSYSAAVRVENSATYALLFKANTNYGTYKTIGNSDLGFYNQGAGNISILNDFSTGNINFAAGGSSTAQMTLTSGGGLLANYLVEANTAGSGSPNILTATESRTILTNEGSTARNYHTLPTAVAGLTYSFIVQDVDGIRITANTGDTIRIGSVVSASAGYIEASAIGDSIVLVAINATEWMSLGSPQGSWSVT